MGDFAYTNQSYVQDGSFKLTMQSIGPWVTMYSIGVEYYETKKWIGSKGPEQQSTELLLVSV